jgi:hypothetical protein
MENNELLGFRTGMKVSDLLKSWSFIQERVQKYNGKLTFCHQNTNRKATFTLDRVPKRILNADVVNYYTLRNDALVIIRMGL